MESNKKTYDYLFKFVMIGDLFVGKSSLLVRFADDYFSESYTSTVGVDFRFRSIQVNQKLINLQIWDTTGQEKYKAITDSYLKKANGVIFVFDITDKDTFINLHAWVEDIQEKMDQDVKYVAIANKSDLKDNSSISERDVI